MGKAIKKVSVVVLILIGGVLGYWLARQNQKLFELPHPEKSVQQTPQRPSDRFTKIAIGMDTWQVQEVLGPPDGRNVITESGQERTEAWRYGNKRLFFINGFLASWQE
jgi:hypothetical protein